VQAQAPASLAVSQALDILGHFVLNKTEGEGILNVIDVDLKANDYFFERDESHPEKSKRTPESI